MSYRLEVAFKLRNTGCISQLRDEVQLIAENYGCEHSYVDIEFWGRGRTIKRNHMIIVLYFPENPKHIINFLNFIKKNQELYIESVGFDNCRFTLLYASKAYLGMMDKYKAREYLSNKKNITNEDFQKVIKAV